MSNESETKILQKLDENRRSIEVALSALGVRVSVLEQWKSTTDDHLKDTLPYLREKLDTIDNKVDDNRVQLAKWAGAIGAIVFLVELVVKLI